MFIVNLFGAPGSGKSTGAAYLFSQLRMRQINCELTEEFPKQLRWEGRDIARKNHIFIFANHLYKIECLQKETDIIISDSPLPLSIFYNDNNYIQEEFTKLILKVFNSFNTINYLLVRDFQYNEIGRYQTEEQSDDIDKDLREFLLVHEIPYTEMISNRKNYDIIINEIIDKAKQKTK